MPTDPTTDDGVPGLGDLPSDVDEGPANPACEAFGLDDDDDDKAFAPLDDQGGPPAPVGTQSK